jgi:ubiquinone/menaquinone biosynthesis C-methylase UbiE
MTMDREAISHQPTFASFYDFYDGPEYRQRQLAMYRELAGQAGEKILELACGTGIITLDLARAGQRVMGLDISAEMLAVAREKIARQDSDVQSRIRLVEADMKCFQLGEAFDAIFLPSNSFGYLTATQDRRSCLRAIQEHLRPGGLMVIEERNYTPDVLQRMSEERLCLKVQMARVNPGTGRHTTFYSETTRIDFISQTINSRMFIDEVQADRTVRRYHRGGGGAIGIHYFNCFELQLLIEQAGFEVLDLWGSHDRQPPGPGSYNMIFVAAQPTS